MDNKMFCFQCEQTALCTGCTGKAGVCGKTADVAKLQDELTGALVGLARATDNAPDVNGDTWRLMIEGLFTTVTNVNFNEETIRALIDRVHGEKARLVPDCAVCASACGRTDDYDMEKLWGAQEDIRSLKSLILFGVRGMAAYAHHAMVLGYTDEEVNSFLAKALFAVGEDWGMGRNRRNQKERIWNSDMKNFTVEEINLMCCFNTSSRKRLICDMKSVPLNDMDGEIAELMYKTIRKLESMSDAEFEELYIMPDGMVDD